MQDTGFLGVLVDKGYTVTLYCSCGYSTTLDLPALAARLGRDHGALRKDLYPKLRCSACGQKDKSAGGRAELDMKLAPPPFEPY